MAHPVRSLPPLSFDDPELDAPANDTLRPPDMDAESPALPALTFRSISPAPANSQGPVVYAPVYAIPSIIPEATPDPSFTIPSEHPSAPPLAPVQLPALKAPPPAVTLEEGAIALIERAIELAPRWPAALRFKPPIAAVCVVALALFWMELGLLIRALRQLILALLALGR